MSGTTDPVREPSDNAEWARDTDARISALENPTSQRIGQWVLSTSSEGNLIASHVEGGSVILAKKPTEGENDPDKIEDTVNPSVCATRTNPWTATPLGVSVRFDGTAVSEGGDWTAGKSDYDSVIIPISGTYFVEGTIHFQPGSSATLVACLLRINQAVPFAVGKVYGNSNTWMTAQAHAVHNFNAGDSIDLVAWSSGSGNITVGGNQTWTPIAPTTLSAFLVTRRE